MLSYRQYKLLKQIDTYQKAVSKKYEHGTSQMLHEDFSNYTKYKPYTINTILTELYCQKYIKDTANEIDTKVHAVTITDKGYDALDNFIKHIFAYYSRKSIAYILTILGTLLAEHFFEIISFLKNYLP